MSTAGQMCCLVSDGDRGIEVTKFGGFFARVEIVISLCGRSPPAEKLEMWGGSKSLQLAVRTLGLGGLCVLTARQSWRPPEVRQGGSGQRFLGDGIFRSPADLKAPIFKQRFSSNVVATHAPYTLRQKRIYTNTKQVGQRIIVEVNHLVFIFGLWFLVLASTCTAIVAGYINRHPNLQNTARRIQLRESLSATFVCIG
jgi:hypothetical protein